MLNLVLIQLNYLRGLVTGGSSENIMNSSGSSGIVLNSVLIPLVGISMFVSCGKEKCWLYGDSPVMSHKEGCRFLSILYRGEAEESEVLVSRIKGREWSNCYWSNISYPSHIYLKEEATIPRKSKCNRTCLIVFTLRMAEFWNRLSGEVWLS